MLFQYRTLAQSVTVPCSGIVLSVLCLALASCSPAVQSPSVSTPAEPAESAQETASPARTEEAAKSDGAEEPSAEPAAIPVVPLSETELDEGWIDDLQWFHKTLIADGAHTAAWVNGIQVSDWTDEREPDENPRKGLRTAPGTIMIQGHDPTTNISFRNLQITVLDERQAE